MRIEKSLPGSGPFHRGPTAIAAALLLLALAPGAGAQSSPSSDPLLDLFVKKGYVTQEEAQKVKAEADARLTNAQMPALKWKISDGIKSVELFGDIRMRFEDRQAEAPNDARIDLGRFRYAVRVGLRGDLAGNFNYGLRLETASNPRSPWVTFGTSTSGAPYQGPFGKSTDALSLGQVYLGWHPRDGVEIIVGKMPNPLYNTPMVWDSDINPAGAVEKFKYTVGDVDFFANLAQFLYEDNNPTHTSALIYPTFQLSGQDTSAPFLLAWQGGFNYHISKDVSLKAAVTLYNYDGVGKNNTTPPVGATIPGIPASQTTPGYSDTFVGEGGGGLPGVAVGQNQNAGGLAVPANNDGFIFNQTGLDYLQVLDIPFELDFKIGRRPARFFGDFAQNLEGAQRAEAAAAVMNAAIPASKFVAQKYDNMAWQFGFGVSSGADVGMVYGSVVKKNTWDARVYWQHVEQYALDPNLLDSDFFEGRGNLQGLYSALAYGFTDNLIGTLRYGYATRINNKLGTGGSNQDIPSLNPIKQYELLQLDLTCRF
ncbi:MAG: putative porin [Verrucomicrobiota bacterium]|jgi:hypothetical protein